MFKSLLTLFRGADLEAAAAEVESSIVMGLERQFDDYTMIEKKARRSVAIAMAQQRQEEERFNVTCHGIADLEARTKWAIDDGDEILAREAAEVIASLESERDASRKAMQMFDKEARRMASVLRTAEARLEELQRGQRAIAEMNIVQKSCEEGSSDINTLTDAEVMLEKLRLRQNEIDDVTAMLEEKDQPVKPVLVAQDTCDEDSGVPVGSSADTVLARLRMPKNTQVCSF